MSVWHYPLINCLDADIVKESPTADDTLANYYKEFLVCTVVEFIQQACLALLVSTDKSNAKRSKFSKYLNKAVDIGVTGGIAAIPVAAPIAKGAGKITGELVEKLISEHEKSKQHKDGKLIEHLLKTFQPEDREWIMFLLDSFSTIFIWLVPFDYLINGVTSSKYFASQKHFRTVTYHSETAEVPYSTNQYLAGNLFWKHCILKWLNNNF